MTVEVPLQIFSLEGMATGTLQLQTKGIQMNEELPKMDLGWAQQEGMVNLVLMQAENL